MIFHPPERRSDDDSIVGGLSGMAVRNDLRGFVVDYLGTYDVVPVVDETGDLNGQSPEASVVGRTEGTVYPKRPASPT